MSKIRGYTTQKMLDNLTPSFIEAVQREDIFDDDEDDIADQQREAREERRNMQETPRMESTEQQELTSQMSNTVTKQTGLQEIQRIVAGTNMPLSNEFNLPPDSESTSFINLVRRANMNARYARNLFY